MSTSPWRVRARRPTVPARRHDGEVLVDAVGITVVRGTRSVLEAASLQVCAGEVVALVGPNGAGKSTLLAAVLGDVASSGEIMLDGRSANEWSAAELALRRAAMPQHSNVAFPFVVADVVRMARAPWRRVAAPAADAAGVELDDDRAIADALQAADAIGLADRTITTLSGGERARVALARLLAQRAQLLLLDEPTAALDLGHQEMVMRTLRERARAGDGVVVVLHDLSLAAAHADRLVVLANGCIVADGSPAQVADPRLLAQVYGAPIEVIPHPTTRVPIIQARRG